MTLQQLEYVVCIANQKSMNQAAAKLFISQPSLSSSIKELEKEIGIVLFSRSNRGVVMTSQGEEFLGYARQMLEHYRLIEERYLEKKTSKKKFSVSMQHYTFAVQSFISLVKEIGMEEYEFAIHETKTYEVIQNVKNQKSEVGVLYQNEFNQKVLNKIFFENELEFIPLFSCDIYVYLSKDHPLASKTSISFEALQEYPCLTFEQGDYNSFYFAEEVFSTNVHSKMIKADDRATMLNLMVGLHGYTLCSGIICEELNGDHYTAVPLETQEQMVIGYIKKKKLPLSSLGEMYIEELKKYQHKVMR